MEMLPVSGLISFIRSRTPAKTEVGGACIKTKQNKTSSLYFTALGEIKPEWGQKDKKYKGIKEEWLWGGD